MEDDFWNQRKEENKDHCVVEYKNGIQYVYACKCNQCLPPMTTLKPEVPIKPGKLSTDDCEYCYFNDCNVHINERLVLYKNKDIPKSNKRRARKQEH
jgi:hypothetical protein